jgi:GT2 family glycosyltransferase
VKLGLQSSPSGGAVNNDNLPFVSIIVVNYNGKHFLGECFASLENLDYPRDKFEVILVDNASTDGSVQYVRENFTRVNILQLDKNYGFCKPNNDGVKLANGEYVVFLNNDTVVTKEWLFELVKGALSEERIASCASKMLYYDRRNMINTAGGKITIIGGGFYKGYGDKDGPKYSKLEYTGFGCGAGVLVRKELFQYVGGFDEDYFASCEEHDLGWKLWLYGYKVLYVPTAVMYHKESGTFRSRSTFESMKVYLITRNRLYNIIKNLEARNVIRALIISLGFNLYRSVRYLAQGNFASVNSIAAAHLDFVKNLRKMLAKRRVVQKNRKLSDIQLYKLGVIATLKESISEERRLNRIWRDEFYKI